MMKNENKLWIFDVDGTLSNNDHRIRHLNQHNKKDWDKFFAEQHLDDPYDAVFEIMNGMTRLGQKCIVITARDERFRDVTLEWINNHYDGEFKSEDLYMRANGDRRDDDFIKLEVLKEILNKNPLYTVMGIFEDRHRVIDSWREAGYYVFECNQSRTEF